MQVPAGPQECPAQSSMPMQGAVSAYSPLARHAETMIFAPVASVASVENPSSQVYVTLFPNSWGASVVSLRFGADGGGGHAIGRHSPGGARVPSERHSTRKERLPSTVPSMECPSSHM